MQGLEALEDLEEKLERFVFVGIDHAIEKVIDQKTEMILDLNRQQLDQGLRADGTALPPYSPRTVKEKILMGKQSDPMNLEDTGSFRAKMGVRKYKDNLEIYSEDSKEALLLGKYGEVEGLTDQNKDVVSQSMIPDLIQEAVNYIL